VLWMGYINIFDGQFDHCTRKVLRTTAGGHHLRTDLESVSHLQVSESG
jgi:hypothetical protein